ncbi:MAG: helix-turn-helix transcriptional regulator [Lentisphaeria bacterium]|nr:helix-turn-helix transcriptional regulator [Lentisphaeria bacterium]
MSKIDSTQTLDPESYDVWDAGQKNYVQKAEWNLKTKKNLPLIPYRAMDIIRTDKRWFRHVNYHSLALELIISGEMEYQNENCTMIAKAGMMYIVSRGSNVRMVKSGDESRRKFTLLITGSCLDSISASLGFDKDQLLSLPDPELVEKMMREIAMGIGEQISPEKLSCKTYELLLYLSTFRTAVPQVLLPVINVLANEPVRRFSIPEMAKMCGISESTLRRLFRQHFGNSPQEYRRKIRLTAGKELLRNRDITIKEVAARCGFDSPLRFSQLFKACFGITPHEWRKNIKGTSVC